MTSLLLRGALNMRRLSEQPPESQDKIRTHSLCPRPCDLQACCASESGPAMPCMECPHTGVVIIAIGLFLADLRSFRLARPLTAAGRGPLLGWNCCRTGLGCTHPYFNTVSPDGNIQRSEHLSCRAPCSSPVVFWYLCKSMLFVIIPDLR
jgi:hypothetical protein